MHRELVDELMVLLLFPGDGVLRKPAPCFAPQTLDAMVGAGLMRSEGGLYALTDEGRAEQAMLLHDVSFPPGGKPGDGHGR
jgi:hypothetical protein